MVINQEAVSKAKRHSQLGCSRQSENDQNSWLLRQPLDLLLTALLAV